MRHRFAEEAEHSDHGDTGAQVHPGAAEAGGHTGEEEGDADTGKLQAGSSRHERKNSSHRLCELPRRQGHHGPGQPAEHHGRSYAHVQVHRSDGERRASPRQLLDLRLSQQGVL